MKTKIILFFTSFLTWILLNWSLERQRIIAGLVIAVLVALLTADIFIEKLSSSKKGISRYLWFLYYIPVFIWGCIRANIDGAWRLMQPGLPIRPGIVKVRTTLKSDAGLTFLANSLTLTPGTMTVDIDKENGFLYVHWIDVKSQDIEEATKLIVDKFERILKRIFE